MVLGQVKSPRIVDQLWLSILTRQTGPAKLLARKQCGLAVRHQRRRFARGLSARYSRKEAKVANGRKVKPNGLNFPDEKELTATPKRPQIEA
jgi:hypothetical protein